MCQAGGIGCLLKELLGAGMTGQRAPVNEHTFQLYIYHSAP